MHTLTSRTSLTPPRWFQSLVLLALTLALSGCCWGGSGDAKPRTSLPTVPAEVDSDLEVLTPFPVKLAEVLALEGKDGRSVEYEQFRVSSGDPVGGLGRLCAHAGPVCLVAIPLAFLGLGPKDKVVTVLRDGRVELVAAYDPDMRFVKGWWREGDTLHHARVVTVESFGPGRGLGLGPRLAVHVARGPAGKWPEEKPTLPHLPQPLLLERFTQALSRTPPNTREGHELLAEAADALGDASIPFAESVRQSRPGDFRGFLEGMCPPYSDSPLTEEGRKAVLARLAQRPTPAEAIGVLNCFYTHRDTKLPPEGARVFLASLSESLCREDSPALRVDTLRGELHLHTLSPEFRAAFLQALSSCPDSARRTLARLELGVEVDGLTAEELDAALASEAVRREGVVEQLHAASPAHAAALLRAWRRNHLTPGEAADRLYAYHWTDWEGLPRDAPSISAEGLALARAVLLQHRPEPCEPELIADVLRVLNQAARRGTVPEGYVAQLKADGLKAPEPMRRRLLLARLVLGERELAGEVLGYERHPVLDGNDTGGSITKEEQLLSRALRLAGCEGSLALGVAEARDAGHPDVLCTRPLP